MYLAHYGLHELPFTLTPNTSFYCDLAGHRDALEVLLTALNSGEGFIKVVGEVGTGKTLLCRQLLNEIPQHYTTAYIPNPYLSPVELRQAIAHELGVQLPDTDNQQQLAQALQQRLLTLSGEGHPVVIILDEAQALPDDSLEALRLLSNLETERRKLLHVILLGQPELDQRLASPSLRQLRQRMSFSYQLTALNLQETAGYISHRLQVAGYRGPALFSATLVTQLHRASRGIPRLINVLCHKMLMLGYGAGRYRLGHEDLRLAVLDTDDASWQRRSRSTVLISLLSFSLIAAFGYVYWSHLA
ncbi:ExeA family protein [Idiomarina xiamenensis]|uniref:General secretion pathway ATPase n=1 Tax=Idiomarina xiamenensis 10-D-4 TaxID=740709 RepID=K2KF78_9GAMM|nr:AAA family ATPase [Idiomarina xiamenensis]EKE85407.1 general secretion pathway ATPase [Idiomarina xiamenensis 10-D-4]